MPRKPRIHFNGAVYHVIARGNNRAPIFAADYDKKKYLEKIAFYKGRYLFELFAYVIMTNHVHLLLRVGDVPLSKIMQSLQQSYTQYYNKVYKRSGHVFQQRYNAFLCEDNSYFLTLIKYIHYNPMRAGICPGLNYDWSSHGYYTGLFEGDLVDREFIYNMVRDGGENVVVGYKRFMQQDFSLNEKYWLAENVGEPEEGFTVFDDWLRELLQETAQSYGISISEILSKQRSEAIAAARQDLIARLTYEYNWSQTRIAQTLGVSKSYVNQILK